MRQKKIEDARCIVIINTLQRNSSEITRRQYRSDNQAVLFINCHKNEMNQLELYF